MTDKTTPETARYNITTYVGARTIELEKPIDDPFVHHAVHIHWRDLLRALLTFRRFLIVKVIIDGDREIIRDVMNLGNGGDR